MSLHLHYRQQLNLLGDFQNYFLLYRPNSVESLLEVIINAIGKRININQMMHSTDSQVILYQFSVNAYDKNIYCK